MCWQTMPESGGTVHELGVTQSLLQVVLAHAAEAGAGRIVRINLVVGELSGIVGESVQFYFDVVSQETPAAGAELRIERRPARFRCQACGHEYGVAEAGAVRPEWAWQCPACGELRPTAIGGREFLVESIEVE
jgi:hydrogenase nickel incorporation protein HypA/HybF